MYLYKNIATLHCGCVVGGGETHHENNHISMWVQCSVGHFCSYWKKWGNSLLTYRDVHGSIMYVVNGHKAVAKCTFLGSGFVKTTRTPGVPCVFIFLQRERSGGLPDCFSTVYFMGPRTERREITS